MAIFAGTATRYDIVGIREDLSNVIYNISPMDTQLVTRSGKGKADNTLFEWQTDALAATDTGNAHLEGDDITTISAVSPTVRVANHCQISRKLLSISGTVEAVKKAGRMSELAYQIAKRGRELKRDIESICFANIGGEAGSSTTARRTATLGAWLKTNVNFATASGGNPTYTSGVPTAARTDATSGDQRALTVTIFKDVIQQMWTEGADLDSVFVYAGPVNKQLISAFAGIATKQVNISDASRSPTVTIAAVDVFVSDFGAVRIFPSRYQRERDVWFIDHEYVEIAALRPFRVEQLGKTGDATKEMLLQEWGLRVKQEAALGLAADLTTS